MCSLRCARLLASIAPLFFASAAALGQCRSGPPSATDLFDASGGTVVTGVSGAFMNDDPAGLFGGSFGNFEHCFNFMFADGNPPGYVHWVEWRTASAVQVGAIALYGGEENAAVNFRRGFDRFSLYAWNGSGWTLLFEDIPSHPAPSIASGACFNLTYFERIAPTLLADRYRAEFTQRPLSFPDQYPACLCGPRIFELDAWASVCLADFNCDGTVNSQDFFDFLGAFFGTAPSADFNTDGAINSQDFFDFLAAFFTGC